MLQPRGAGRSVRHERLCWRLVAAQGTCGGFGLGANWADRIGIVGK